jgi:Transposase DDE domain
MVTIAQLSGTLLDLFTESADRLARQTGFVQRQSKLTGAAFAQTLAFGWQAKPTATLSELAQTAAAVEVDITPQGLDQRFTPAAAQFFRLFLAEAVSKVLAADPVAIPLLNRFNGVYLLDSSKVMLPEGLASVWAGNGGRTGQGSAALQFSVRFNLVDGGLMGPELANGRMPDACSALQTAPLPVGALRLADLGYFDLVVWRDYAATGVYLLTRWKVGTVLTDQEGNRLDLVHLLAQQTEQRLELAVLLGAEQRLPCRLLAARVPKAVAAERRRKLREDARVRRQPPSATRLALADWTIYLTNVPVEQLSLEQALVLGRARWQIELLFKLWKDHGRVDEWRSQNHDRICVEIYAKLLAMVVQHWYFLVSFWRYPDRSLRKAAAVVQPFALSVAMALRSPAQLEHVLVTMQRCLRTGCRINPRQKHPNTYQLLLNPSQEALA